MLYFFVAVDACGNAINIPFNELDKMRVSCHTLREFRPGIGGQLCEVLYQLITSLDCFTIHWCIDNPDIVDHYRIYQIKIDSGVAKLLGHVTESHFKVTWFEIPDYEKDELSHHFKFVLRPVLKNGVVVPLDYNYCQLFHIASKRESVTLVKDSSSGSSDQGEHNKKEEVHDPYVEQASDGYKKRDNNVSDEFDVSGDCRNETTEQIENLTQNLHISEKKSE